VTSQVNEFIAKYTPEIAATVKRCRQKMHSLVPSGYELIYDNYNALGFGFAPSEKTSSVVLSVVAYPRWVTLFFLKGANLVDPQSLLEGTGSQVRSIRLKSPSDLDKPSIKILIKQALEPYSDAFSRAPKIKSIVKSVSTRQRPRRPVTKEPMSRSSKKSEKRPTRNDA